LLAALAAALVAGCAGSPVPPQPSRDTQSQSDDAVIAEMGSPRARARAHTDLAAAYYELGKMAIALDEARIALAADASYAPAYNVLGLVHMDLKENREAEASFERALSIAPNDPDANHNYGWFLCQTGREQQAGRYFLAAVRNPLYATPHKSFAVAGACALRRNDEAEAIDYFERALRVEPNFMAAVLPLAQLRYRRGELDAARTLVARFNRQGEATAESLWLALRVERRLGDKTAENDYAEQLRRRFAGSREHQALQKGLYD
jgi:type IV pilus assembly protein PilF